MSPADIIASLEKLTGPSREVDRDIAEAVGWERKVVSADQDDYWRRGDHSWTRENGETPPRYTASLDAIVALIEQKLPREAKVSITHCVNIMWLVSPAPIAELPRRRLCIALLKALESGQ